ncbi:MAG: hypothetical protein OSJ61_03645 [Lachnospiraceae bacterium]|nr:hypothetical protein [Lachnospiraceae bacterium]
MSEFYYLFAADSYESPYLYLCHDNLGSELIRGCKNSEFQYIPSKIGVLLLDENSGDSLPDFICDRVNCVPLISERLKALFDELQIKNLYYQRVSLCRNKDNLHESYWLAIPPRIDCIDFERSTIDDMWNTAEVISIDKDKIGNYHIFKLLKVVNDEIIITNFLKEQIEKKGFTTGLAFLSDNTLT